MRFEKLTLRGWRQFSNIDIDFHSRLTVIAGANGAGKSTLLRVLSQHFGYSFSLVATPTLNKAGLFDYFAGLFGPREPDRVVGHLTYSGAQQTKLHIPETKAATYNLQIANMQQVYGLFINSHRPLTHYQAVSNIPANAISAEQAYQAYSQELQNKYTNAFTHFSPTYRIKEAIISMATFGPGNKNVQGNTELEKTYDDFKAMLAKVLPPTIGFVDINVRIPDVVVVTKTGEFALDAASGGLMALIDLAWQVFLYSRGKSEFTVVMDEPENHLHPSMQRAILGQLLDAFPNAQFIVATHSPFVVSSVKNSAVYVLRYAENEGGPGASQTVLSQRLESVSKGGTAGDILRTVLGVPVTMPIWAEQEIETIASEFEVANLDRESIAKLRSRLEAAGLEGFYAEALNRVTTQQ